MTPTQKTFLMRIGESKKLHPEVYSAIELLIQEDLEPEQVVWLVDTLLHAPEVEDGPDFTVGGVIRG